MRLIHAIAKPSTNTIIRAMPWLNEDIRKKEAAKKKKNIKKKRKGKSKKRKKNEESKKKTANLLNMMIVPPINKLTSVKPQSSRKRSNIEKPASIPMKSRRVMSETIIDAEDSSLRVTTEDHKSAVSQEIHNIEDPGVMMRVDLS